MRQLESEVENKDVLAKKYNECETRYHQAKELMETLKEDIKELRVASDKRHRFYSFTVDYFITCVKSSFEKVLKSRQFKVS